MILVRVQEERFDGNVIKGMIMNGEQLLLAPIKTLVPFAGTIKL
tara:strand:- start:995 stop:1126 length:132 start_codon:yes stop_codon:yes gene_type:complete